MEASGMCDDDCDAAEHVNCPACDAPLDWGDAGYDWERAAAGGGSEDEDLGVCGATLAFICENQVGLVVPIWRLGTIMLCSYAGSRRLVCGAGD